MSTVTRCVALVGVLSLGLLGGPSSAGAAKKATAGVQKAAPKAAIPWSPALARKARNKALNKIAQLKERSGPGAGLIARLAGLDRERDKPGGEPRPDEPAAAEQPKKDNPQRFHRDFEADPTSPRILVIDARPLKDLISEYQAMATEYGQSSDPGRRALAWVFRTAGREMASSQWLDNVDAAAIFIRKACEGLLMESAPDGSRHPNNLKLFVHLLTRETRFKESVMLRLSDKGSSIEWTHDAATREGVERQLRGFPFRGVYIRSHSEGAPGDQLNLSARDGDSLTPTDIAAFRERWKRAPWNLPTGHRLECLFLYACYTGLSHAAWKERFGAEDCRSWVFNVDSKLTRADIMKYEWRQRLGPENGYEAR